MIRVSDETQKVLLDIFVLGGVAAIEESETRLRDMAREYAQAQRELRSAALAFSTYNGLDIERGLEGAARTFAAAREELLDAATELALSWQVNGHDAA